MTAKRSELSENKKKEIFLLKKLIFKHVFPNVYPLLALSLREYSLDNNNVIS